MTDRPRLTPREVKAKAFHLVDLITTKAHAIAKATGLPFEQARDRAIAEMAGE